MLEFFKYEKRLLKATRAPTKGCWTNAIQPSSEELERLRKLICFPDEVLASIKDIDEIPLLERYDDFFFFIVRIPKQKPTEHELEHSTVPLGILLSKDYFITICFFENDVTERLKRAAFPTRGIAAVLHLLLATAKTYLRHLKAIGAELYKTQEDLERSTENEAILQLLELEKSLVYFGTALKANQSLTEKLARHKSVISKEENRELIQDILIESGQANATNKTYGIIISEMMSAFSSIISNNLNKVIKTLTVITLIIMLPTLVSSIYGMNIALPFQSSPHAFTLIMTLALLLGCLGAMILWKRKIL